MVVDPAVDGPAGATPPPSSACALTSDPATSKLATSDR